MHLTTARLILRPVELAEAQQVADRITPKIHRWTSAIPWPYTIEDAIEWIEVSVPAERLGIYRTSDQSFIGTISLPTEDGGEIGFVIFAGYEGQGYATEAVNAVIDHALLNLGLGTIHSTVHVDNEASLAIHKKMGFEVIAREERFWPHKEANVWVCVMQLTRERWEAGRTRTSG